ncbi:MAG: hypothetical protein J5701_01575 [Bacteroidales bacterium]|nr:hypothetical protein [Bacteroidales bacterium]
MKNKILIIILLFCFFCGYTQVFVTKSEAIAVATKYMQHHFEDKTFQIEDVSYVSDLKKTDMSYFMKYALKMDVQL